MSLGSVPRDIDRSEARLKRAFLKIRSAHALR
jgi:hypothetical protein